MDEAGTTEGAHPPHAGATDPHVHHRRKDVARRLARAAGHLEAVRRMVESDRECPEILRQIAAVRAALDATAKVVLADHMETCLHDAAGGDAEQAWQKLATALQTFIR